MTVIHIGRSRAISIACAIGIAIAPGAVRAADEVATPPASPTVELLSLERKLSAGQDDVRVTVELDQNPLVAGQPTWVTTRVKNLGDTDVLWEHAALCPIAVWVTGEHQDAEWRVGDQRRSGYDSLRGYAEHDMGYPEIQLRFTP